MSTNKARCGTAVSCATIGRRRVVDVQLVACEILVNARPSSVAPIHAYVRNALRRAKVKLHGRVSQEVVFVHGAPRVAGLLVQRAKIAVVAIVQVGQRVGVAVAFRTEVVRDVEDLMISFGMFGAAIKRNPA